MRQPQPVKMIKLLLTLLLPAALITCSSSPSLTVNKRSERNESEEIAIGERLYPAAQQSGGGLYTMDLGLGRYIAAVGRKLTKYSERPHLPYEFVVLNNSMPDSWALPGGKIAISWGILTELNSEAELAAILAHKIAHVSMRMEKQGKIAGAKKQREDLDVRLQTLQRGLALYIGYDVPRYDEPFAIKVDKHSMQMLVSAGYDPTIFVALLEGVLAPASNPALHTLFTTQSSSQERLVAAKESLKNFLPMGMRNRKDYRNALATLRRRQPAYEFADRAVDAIISEDYHQALALSDRALKIERGESRFYEIKALSLVRLNRARDALRALDQSIRLDPGYYRPLARRGLLRHQLKAAGLAKADFEASLALAPSQIAFEKLGEIAESEGRCPEAISYYLKALQLEGEQRESIENRIAALKLTCG